MPLLRRGLLLFCLAAVSVCAAPPTKIVLIAGTQSHGFGDHEYRAGCVLLAKFLKQNGVANPVVITGGWPESDLVFEGASAVVLFSDGGTAHPMMKDAKRLDTIAALMRKGVGLACLHYAVEVPKDPAGPLFLDWIGGYYERPYSTNPFSNADLVQASPDHPISRGWKNFHLRDEWYYRIRFQPGDQRVTPILTSMLPPKEPNREVLAWATQREDGGRGFGFTGLHPHRNWGVPEFRRLLVNAVLWTAKVDIPEPGARCDLEPDDLTSNFFVQPKKK
jgi:type 1 glutamine amidotransferase